VTPPENHGFGTTFITRSVEYDLDGEVAMRFEPQGLRFEMNIPLPATSAAVE
jgi:two-component sensor histidine kinase